MTHWWYILIYSNVEFQASTRHTWIYAINVLFMKHVFSQQHVCFTEWWLSKLKVATQSNNHFMRKQYTFPHIHEFMVIMCYMWQKNKLDGEQEDWQNIFCLCAPRSWLNSRSVTCQICTRQYNRVLILNIYSTYLSRFASPSLCFTQA